MFQYAFAKAMATRYHDKFSIDPQQLFHDTRGYELGIFNIEENLANSSQRPRYLIFFKNKFLHNIRYLIRWICKKMDPYYFIENYKHPLVHI